MTTMHRLMKEPLIHFLALGAILFGIGFLRGEGTGPATNRIAITPGAVERLIEGFRRTWQRPPTEDEFRGLVEEYLKEEVLYREGLAMGLDRDDQIIRRRMRQKLEFLTADLVESIDPTDDELREYYDTSPDRYRRDAALGFTQIYFRQQGEAERTHNRAAAALKVLLTEPDADPESMGDPFMYPTVYRDMSERQLLGMYGSEFASQLVDLPLGEWSGPVTSAFGVHVARLDALEQGGRYEFDEVRNEVYRDLVYARTRDTEQQYFEGLLSQYTVTVDWPKGMEPVSVPGVVQ